MSPAPHMARQERAALADLLLDVGPDAPTLCEGWNARDLAAHLVTRDRRPDTLPGTLLPVLAWWTDAVRDRQARAPWTDLVELVRQGPPRWSPTSLEQVDRAANSLEMYVHHEDVRRAGSGWEPRELGEGGERSLWHLLQHPARVGYRTASTRVELRAVLRDGTRIGELGVGSGDPVLTLEGPPSELALHAFGRRGAARLSRESRAPSAPRPH